MDSKLIVKCEKIGKKSHYKVSFPFNTNLINKIKELPKDDRIWDGEEKSWHLKTKSLYKLISSFSKESEYWFDFSIDDKQLFIDEVKELIEDEKNEIDEKTKFDKWKKEVLNYKNWLEENFKKDEERILSKLKNGTKLYPHQTIAILFLEKVKNALLALDMGVGKTLSAISYVEVENYKKALVITPNSLKFNFFDEVEKFSFSKAHVISGKNNFFSVNDAKYVILNYEFFRDSDFKKVQSKLEKFKINIKEFDVVILDESQKIKNSKSNSYKNIKKIINSKNIKSKIFLSGTPAPNRAIELYNVLHEVSPLEFPTKGNFYSYCGMTYNMYTGMWEQDLSKTRYEELFHKMSPFVYRKKKEDVLKDLPEKIYQSVKILKEALSMI
jgi:SNF2 family DNA or RNA helicase